MKTIIKNIVLLCAGMVAALSASAQEMGNLLRHSQYNYSLSTPRSAAMGGAFTSLGADLSSMSMNPAGLGLYRSTEALISPQYTISSMDSNYGGMRANDSKSKFTLGSLGIAINVSQRSRGLVSFTLGIGYNKLVDFNTTQRIDGANKTSMLHYLGNTVGGEDAALLGDFPAPFDQLGLGQYGGILAYQTWMLDETSPGSRIYVPHLLSGTKANMMLYNNNSGSVGEYVISGGFNIDNLFYFGLSVGIQDLYFRNENVYYEVPSGDQGPVGLGGYRYTKSLVESGTGVNLKFGVMAMPVKNLRIGVAVHTPTFTSMENKYIENMASSFNGGPSGDRTKNYYNFDSSPRVFNYDMNTAARLLSGISYALPGIGLISADYERVWYDGMRVKGTNDWSYEQDIKDQVKELCRPANNFRVGLELTPTSRFFVRGGFAYYDCGMRYADLIGISDYRLCINSYQNYSAGIGYRFSNNISLDLTYVYTDYNYINSELYPYAADDPDNGFIKTDQSRHTIMMAFGIRF